MYETATVSIYRSSILLHYDLSHDTELLYGLILGTTERRVPAGGRLPTKSTRGEQGCDGIVLGCTTTVILVCSAYI